MSTTAVQLNADEVEPESVLFLAKDGYQLGALRYPATCPLRGHLIVAGATGVPQLFYRRFAQFAARRGYSTLTLDYRGVGKSKPATLRGFRMRYLDWAYLDLSAALSLMTSDGVPLFLVGHSFGGHAFGLLDNHHQVTGFYTFGTGAGWHGWMPRGEQLKVLFMWHVFGPLVTRWKGYLAWSAFGFGEDLPLDVYRDWKRWSGYPRYFFDDPGQQALQAKYDAITTPMVAANASDDVWATPASRDAFMTAYRNASVELVTIDPAANGIKGIGHMGYFRRDAQPLWEDVLQWFERCPPEPRTQ